MKNIAIMPREMIVRSRINVVLIYIQAGFWQNFLMILHSLAKSLSRRYIYKTYSPSS